MNSSWIGGTELQFISPLIPEVDGLGKIIEEQPAPRYRNVKGLPLNKYGNGPFCRFKILACSTKAATALHAIGVYAILSDSNTVLYIGKCTGHTSTLGKRFDYGYGAIQPRNCYQGGQSTNCRINNLVLNEVKRGKRLSVFFHKTLAGSEASALEATLIRQMCKPPWNIQKPR